VKLKLDELHGTQKMDDLSLILIITNFSSKIQFIHFILLLIVVLSFILNEPILLPWFYYFDLNESILFNHFFNREPIHLLDIRAKRHTPVYSKELALVNIVKDQISRLTNNNPRHTCILEKVLIIPKIKEFL
ncbi:hypothetical protein ACJX0J_036098, partial [Zea mays]